MIRMHSQVPTLRKQAEEEIQRFRYLPKPINVCQHILEHSGSLGARFQASTFYEQVLTRMQVVDADRLNEMVPSRQLEH